MVNTRINAQDKTFEIDIEGVLTFVVTTNVNHYSYLWIVNEEYIDCDAGRFWQLVDHFVEVDEFVRITNHLHDFIDNYGCKNVK